MGTHFAVAQEASVISSGVREAAAQIISQTQSVLGPYEIFTDGDSFKVSADSEALKSLDKIIFHTLRTLHTTNITDKSQIGFLIVSDISTDLGIPFNEALSRFCQLKDGSECSVFSSDISEKICSSREETIGLRQKAH